MPPAPMYPTPEAFDEKVKEYFEAIQEDKAPITMSGLAFFMGFADKQSLYDYEKRPLFSYSVKRARLAVESGYERRLFDAACTGAIFALKNMGWSDKQEIAHEGGLTIEVCKFANSSASK